ncbi:tRNA (guanosine(37)-N1)-methyltransferase TrmD [Nocardioides sp. Y6]|uniref:tRNA (guanine-N(1)-)-methyltransferase n=1 Tax=Nocardioides malaquae TaxID=2773426 RepID=A0ABR9RP83_9ACTN|nr:tRNA (guanosine(37)-N1)-methyltransferase TrmD [Nocardioides malaquae]MBE7323363.1 tRNA (guanosine(37)-N1)-methyltransferase TrmD [Nocardioides malaquae]
MRVDVVSIFPDYLAPLELSLPGKARAKGLLDVRVHDLRDWTHDRHRTVDDSPYGGGAGMVMKPEPWGEALDEVTAGSDPVIVFTTPSGEPFTQKVARELAAEEHLIFACGRYEGIDQRVIDHAGAWGRVREISLGDYVLNGGEVAALAVTEAVVRLLPGFMGNPDSLVEESHEDGLLEYPVYTKPAVWREHAVPDVLLGGNHRAIGEWRHEQRVRRTARRRPDLVAASALPDDTSLRLAQPADAGEIYTLQRACWLTGLLDNPGVEIPALVESLDDVRAWLGEWTVLVAHRGGRLVAAARGRVTEPGEWAVERLMVAPDLQGQGLGRWMLERIEEAAPEDTSTVVLFTGAGSSRNLKMYRRAGYRPAGEHLPGVLSLRKRRPIGP